MKGQILTWDAEMGGNTTTFWEPDNSIHLLSSAQTADILEFFE
jgi:hypothetical protein